MSPQGSLREAILLALSEEYPWGLALECNDPSRLRSALYREIEALRRRGVLDEAQALHLAISGNEVWLRRRRPDAPRPTRPSLLLEGVLE